MPLLSSVACAPSSIRHRRFHPKPHAFHYQLNYLWFDPAQLTQICAPAWSWSTQGFNLLSLEHRDFLTGYQGNDISAKVRAVLWQHAQFELNANASIRVLALPRCLGKRFNSVVFYYVFVAPDSNTPNNNAALTQQRHTHAPQWIISEITNTPWDERIAYVHDCREQIQKHGDYNGARFRFIKAFHVSPFMPMQLNYQWQFHWSDSKQFIHMQLFEKNKLKFDASIEFSLQPLTQASQQNAYALRYVLQPFKMLSAIYWQAFRLWLKRIPFFPHPRHNKG